MAPPRALPCGRLPRPSSRLMLPSPSAAAAFSTTARQHKRKTRDANKQRGVSSVYGSGPRERLSMSAVPLPRPRADAAPRLPVDAAHGLWRFFPAPGKLLWTPREAEQHGRAWTVEELRRKSWEDLHALWWRCCRERNLLATSLAELRRAKLGFGDKEFANRDAEILRTMSSVKHALTERFYTWQDAADVARSDPEIDLAAPDGQVYRPAAVEEDEDGAGADGAWPSEAGPAPETEPETAARAGLSDKEAVR